MRRRLVRGLLLAAAGSVVLLLAALWLEHRRPLTLPKPTGPYPVGRISTLWVDSSRGDPFAPTETPRALLAWIWYPAVARGGAPAAPYLPPAWRRALARHAGWLLSGFLTRDPAVVRGHSLASADLDSTGAPYPVVLFRSGIGALALEYATIAEDLASHGYVVIGADTPYSTTIVVMPDGQVVERTTTGNPGDAPMAEGERTRLLEALLTVWSADTRFMADQVARLNAGRAGERFSGQLDLGALGVAGHSFGGATAAQFCHDDPRCRAGADLDGALYGSVVRDGLAQPFLFLLSDHGAAWGDPACTICRDLRRAAAHDSATKVVATLLGADHFSFSDMALTQSQLLRGMFGRLEARTGLATSAVYLLAFFDAHLRGGNGQSLYAAPLVPGVRLESK